MKLFLKILTNSLIVILLTILTQVGGIVYLIYKPFSAQIKKKGYSSFKSLALRLSLFSGFFILSSFVVVPLIAKPFGRVALPLFLNEDYPIRPANFITCLGNRHYVKPKLLKLIKEVSKEINKGKNDKTEIIYLDASFPFIENFPLLPHKSHDDGEKLDICFLFKEKKNKSRVNEPMSFLGYGACIEPKKGETNMPYKCSKKGYFQYSLLKTFTSQSKIETYEFDEKANRELLLLLSRKKATGKIFIEPHLKERLNLKQNKKIRFHGCGAVRHDDHIHLQL
jgi:hypothetical protein